MRFLKVISSGYFHEDHLKGITNPKFQLSIISINWRDIADFKMHKKCRPRFYRLRIWICYIFVYFHDFYAAKLKLLEIEEWVVNFVMNRKNLFWVSKFWAFILNVSFSVRNFIKIQGVGPFPKKHMFFFQEPLIHYWKPSFFYLPNLKKIFWDILNNTEKNDLKVALFLECRSSNLPLATAILTQAMHILIFLKLHCFKFISHVFKPAKDIYGGKKPV